MEKKLKSESQKFGSKGRHQNCPHFNYGLVFNSISLCFRSPVKSIFEGATKYDILHYLEDARDRGLTDVELDLEEEDEEVEEEIEEENKVEYSMGILTLFVY